MAYVFTMAEDLDTDEPKSYIKAVNTKERSQWLEAMNDEIQSLYKNDVWRLVDKPRNQKIKKQMGIQKEAKGYWKWKVKIQG